MLYNILERKILKWNLFFFFKQEQLNLSSCLKSNNIKTSFLEIQDLYFKINICSIIFIFFLVWAVCIQSSVWCITWCPWCVWAPLGQGCYGFLNNSLPSNVSWILIVLEHSCSFSSANTAVSTLLTWICMVVLKIILGLKNSNASYSDYAKVSCISNTDVTGSASYRVQI